MSILKKTKKEIFDETIMKNINRKSKYIDHVAKKDGIPLFTWVDINPTELCNRKCVFCPRKEGDVYPNQNLNMTTGLAENIAGQLREYGFNGGVIFSGHGEPLLHPDIVGLIRVFGTDIHTEMATNGDKLTEGLIGELYDAGLGVLIISMYDGPFQVDYFHNMFAKAGINEDRYVLRDRWYGVEEDYGVKLTNRAGTVKEGNQADVIEDRPCYYLHYCVQVDWNGDVLLCPQDFNKKIKCGNLYIQSLWDIWTSRSMDQYRKVLGEGFRTVYPCNNCNVKGILHGKKHAEAWHKVYEKEK